MSELNYQPVLNTKHLTVKQLLDRMKDHLETLNAWFEANASVDYIVAQNCWFDMCMDLSRINHTLGFEPTFSISEGTSIDEL